MGVFPTNLALSTNYDVIQTHGRDMTASNYIIAPSNDNSSNAVTSVSRPSSVALHIELSKIITFLNDLIFDGYIIIKSVLEPDG